MSITPNIEPSWLEVLEDEFQKPYFIDLKKFLVEEINAKKIIYPNPENIFSAFWHAPFDEIKVVILGQDPYHGPNQAHGLSFSVPREQKKIPPSLQNIYKEIASTNTNPIPKHGNLEHWAEQGVFLLNATLSVEAGLAGSHQNKGWENFTDRVIQELSDKKENIIFLLWGSYAQKKGDSIDKTKHTVLTAPHPSPLSAYRGFMGCGHFEKVNTQLQSQGDIPIEWFFPEGWDE